MIRTTTCPMCDNQECYLVEFKDGTKRYRCDRCDCYYTPAWLMDENLAVLRAQNKESKGGKCNGTDNPRTV